MTAKLVADVVVGIPYGDGTKKKWQKVGALLQMTPNDIAKGPGYVVMLDRTFNPAGAPVSHDGNSVALSTYWPSEQRGGTPTGRTHVEEPAQQDLPVRPKHLKTFSDEDDDIPF